LKKTNNNNSRKIRFWLTFQTGALQKLPKRTTFLFQRILKLERRKQTYGQRDYNLFKR